MTTVIGIDPSLAATGLAIWHDGKLREVRTITTSPDEHVLIRWRRILSVCFAQGTTYADSPTVCAIEEFPFGMKTSGKMADRLGLRALLWYGMDARDVPVAMVNLATLKVYATGDGDADKPAMTAAARESFDVRIANDNEADALWLCRMAIDHYRDAGMGQFDAKRQAACERVEWPAWTPGAWR